LAQVDQGTTVKGTYMLNGLGQRVKKVVGRTTTLFAYDDAGRLLGEYNGSTVVQETLWLGDMPLATVMPSGKGSVVYYIHADHLNTPRRLTDNQKTVVWSWEPASFGATLPNEDPDRNKKLVKYNLRMAGQVSDPETGLFYNYYRDYDAAA
jgi:uncharacterized protein RhaS with RHS repeats